MVAQALGTTYRHLHRVLQEFEKCGLIELNKKTIKILDRENLEKNVKALYIKSF